MTIYMEIPRLIKDEIRQAVAERLIPKKTAVALL